MVFIADQQFGNMKTLLLKTFLPIATTVILMTGCQHMNSRTLNFNTQSTAASEKWIKQNAVTNVQKQALIKVNQAQQRIKQLDFARPDFTKNVTSNAALNAQIFEVTKQNQVANHCAMTAGISLEQITALRSLNFQSPRDAQILAQYLRDSPRIKLDVNAINCGFN